jgi:DNA-binding NtrC family response regulator
VTRILLVDDDRAFCETLEVGLKRRGYDVTFAMNVDDAFARLLETDSDVVLSDLNMPGHGGLVLCEKVVANRPDVPVIVMTAFGNYESAVAAIRAGAYDFIAKPVQLDVLAIALDRAAKMRALSQEVKRLREEVENEAIDDAIGESAQMKKVFDLVARAAPSDASILITGESGTGKELIARSIFKRSRRAQGPFVAINCSAVPEGLLESELFGHVRGAFTDARESRLGLFAKANGGTLFLDEIGDMPLALQPKILRALQERRVRPIGGDAEIAIDVRVIAATHRDLEQAIEEKQFREDLYFRLNVIHIPLPPLRSRVGDVLPIAQLFVRDIAARAHKAVTAISPAAAERLVGYAWPGNVRELQNCIERAVALARFDQIVIEDLPEKIRDYRASSGNTNREDPSELAPMEEVEQKYVTRVLDAVNGNKTAAARILGIERKTLYRKLERWGIEGGK